MAKFHLQERIHAFICMGWFSLLQWSLQLIHSSAAQAVSKTPRLSHIAPIIKSLHWLKIDQGIQYKVLSLTYKTLKSQKPSYLYNLLNLQANTSTRSSTFITLQRSPVNSRLKITDRSFTCIFRLSKDHRYPLSHTSSTNLSHSTNHHLLPLSAQADQTSRFRARCPGVPKGYVRDAFMSRFAESCPGWDRGHHLWLSIIL